MNLPTISPSLPASASTQPLLRCCLTSVQPLLDEKLYEKAFSFLPADGCWALRKEKLLRLQKPEDRALTLAAGLLARLAFLKMDVDFSLLSIEKNGKPAIPDERHFFNLSHSGSYAACVYGTYPCGIDIQKHTPDRFHVAERCFTPLEQKKIREEGAQCFTRIWTVKESYLKYTGQGIRIPLHSIEVLPGRLQQKTAEDPASRGNPVRSGNADFFCRKLFVSGTLSLAGFCPGICLKRLLARTHIPGADKTVSRSAFH